MLAHVLAHTPPLLLKTVAQRDPEWHTQAPTKDSPSLFLGFTLGTEGVLTEISPLLNAPGDVRAWN